MINMFYSGLIISVLHTFADGITPVGVLHLDEITFDRVIPLLLTKGDCLVKFDKRYPYGHKQEAWQAFVSRWSTQTGLFLAEVQLAEGREMNSRLAKRYNAAHPDAWPLYQLFKKGTIEHVEFSGIISADSLSHFISHETGNVLSLDGCLDDLDKLARSFLIATRDERKAMATVADKLNQL